LENCSFDIVLKRTILPTDQSWINKITAVKLFLNKMERITFKDNFEMYFEEEDVYFLVWSFLLRSNDNSYSFKKHISEMFTPVKSDLDIGVEIINLFSIEQLRR
jgi:hypothetical protein